MIDLINHLNNKILINDLIVKKMKYEVNMLFHDYPSKEKAKILATKINGQLDQALIGINTDDKIEIRKKIIENSFLVLPNPISEHIHYGHVFTTLTNFDLSEEDTEKRLCHWLDLNTEYIYEHQMIKSYIKKFKIVPNQPIVKTAAIEYQPKETPETIKQRYRLTYRAVFIPLGVALIFIMSLLLNEKNTEQPSIDVPPVFENTLNDEIKAFIDSYYNTLKVLTIDPYAFHPLDYSALFAFLNHKSSYLIESNYLSTIEELSKNYDINPLLLIAIIGQEQNFVPKEHEDVLRIINNPYNVFGSWIEYNTNFEDATTICLNTIETAKASLPENTDLIEWLNDTYAEDKNWSSGVRTIFTKLQSLN
ncbi:MAG: hypothetical protein JXR88_16605 [Clostridia bacterium]|nr:hypothetical protein [Clostridia bacterium]